MKPLRKLNIEIPKLSAKEREKSPYVIVIPDYVKDVRACLNGLSGAGKRLYKLLLSERRFSNQWVTRKDIAFMLGRDSLLPYDIRLMNELVALGLIEQTRRVRRNLPNGMPNGSEYVYTIPPNVLWACDEIARQVALARKGATNATDKPTPTPTPPRYDMSNHERFFEQYKQSQSKPRRRWFGRK
jgi:predicted transcriptional regulator